VGGEGECMCSSSEVREEGFWVLLTECMISSLERSKEGIWVLLTDCIRDERVLLMDR
jgi:hypothetical protein